MSKLITSTLAAAALAAGLAAPLAAAGAVLGPEASACNAGSGRPAFLVNVSGFKQRSGEVRVQLYPANGSFLAKGKWLRRIDVPVARSGPMRICVPAPRPGTYAIAVRHDVQGNGSDWNDGGGFSRNPKLSLLRYKPTYQQVSIKVGSGVQPVDVLLNYRQGLSIGPARRG